MVEGTAAVIMDGITAAGTMAAAGIIADGAGVHASISAAQPTTVAAATFAGLFPLPGVRAGAP